MKMIKIKTKLISNIINNIKGKIIRGKNINDMPTVNNSSSVAIKKCIKSDPQKIIVEIKSCDSNNRVISANHTKGKLYHKYIPGCNDLDKNITKCFDIINPKTKKINTIPIINEDRYLQGASILTVIENDSNEYIPVLSSSWTNHTTTVIDLENPLIDPNTKRNIVDANGNTLYNSKDTKDSILNIASYYGENKAWSIEFERMALNAFTIESFLDQHQTAISISIVLMSCFVGFMLLWTKIQ